MKKTLLRSFSALSKTFCYITLVQIVSISLLRAEAGNAQQRSLYEVNISLDLRQATVEKVFSSIEEQTEFSFSYNHASIPGRVIDITVQNESLGKVLEQISEKSDVQFRRINENIHVQRKVKNETMISERFDVAAEDITITGQITSETGEGLPGATIKVKGTSLGTITDIEGNYSLTVPETASTLVVSFIGYKTAELTIGGQTVINLTMEPDIGKLEEVIVIGYGTTTKKDFTGAVSSVRSDEITMAPVVSPVEAIQGRVAGLDITRNDGRSGSGMEILLRGNRSLTASSAPIYIIDGIQGSINNLNPNDIESIEVLKDASATAIYGSAGANGVIIITTKKGQAGRLQVDLNSYVSINDNPSYPSPLQGDAWTAYLEEGYKASIGPLPNFVDDLYTGWGLNPDVLNPYIWNDRYVDWADETFQRGIQVNYNISIRGGTEKVQSSFSLGHNRIQGVYYNDQNDVFTLRSDVNISPSKWSRFGIVTGLIYRNQDYNRSRVNKAFGLLPLGIPYDEDGNINTYPIEGDPMVSPLANNIPGTYEKNRKSFNFTANPYVEFKPVKGLTLTSRLGVSLSSGRTGEFQSDHTYLMLTGSSNAVRTGSYGTDLNYSYNWENIADYQVTIGTDHSIGATFITSYLNSQSENSNAYGEDFLYDDFQYYNLSAAAIARVGSGYSVVKRMSYAGRLNYDYKGKYFITGSVRYDGASQLAEQWDMFPAGAVAWRISDESFLDGIDNWVTNLKVRVGYGVTGNSNISPYATRTEATSGTDNMDLGAGRVATTVPTEVIGNTGLGWEKSYNLNVGLDFGFIKDRITGSLEWYNTDSKGVLWERKLPQHIGGVTPKINYVQNANIAEINNHGFEITLNTVNVQTGGFKWTSTLTFSRNNERVESVALRNTSVEDLISEGLFVGYPVNVFYEYRKLGIWQLGEEVDAAVFGLAPGDVKIESSLTRVSEGVWTRTVIDADGNEVIEEYTADNPYTINPDDDRQIIGQEVPNWLGGLQNTFTYKGFDLGVFITARYGQMIDAELLGYMKHGVLNIPDAYDYWTEDNPTNDFPRPYINRSTNFSEPIQALNFVDGSFLKIKNITLGYTLPTKWADKIKVSNLRVYGTMYNAFIFTKSHLLEGMDPETNASDSFPLYKQLVFGLNVSF